MPIGNFQPADGASYSLGGFRVVSDLPLPGLAPCHDNFPACDQIAIRRARIPASLSPVDMVFPNGQCNKYELLLIIPNVARFLLRGDNDILVDPASISNHDEVCAHLIGTVFAVLSYQRGIIPLHASAIDFAGGCVAFMGESGAGKSTLTAALVAHGHHVIADDVCFLKPGDKRHVRVWPGVNRLRLWDDAIAALDYRGPDLQPVWSGWNKFFIPVDPPPNPLESRRLHRIYHLQAASADSLATLNQLRGTEAIDVVLQNAYRLDLAEQIGFKPTAFRMCATVAKEVPVFRFCRPNDLNLLREGTDFLEDHMRDILQD